MNATELAAEAVAEAKKPISQAKLEANRRNAQKSTGPVTPEGKRRSSLNALRSGLHGAIVCLTAEDFAAYTKHTEEILAQFKPSGAMERFYAVSIAENTFRLIRARSFENGMLAQGFRTHVDSANTGHPQSDAMVAQAITWHEQAQQLQALALYENRISRIVDKDTATLKALQKERQEAYDKARQEAQTFAQAAELEGEVYEPGEDFEPAEAYGGFVFSASDLARYADRQRRYAHAGTVIKAWQ